eukprot:15365839-Ditylum_brightwellii.AAC.3
MASRSVMDTCQLRPVTVAALKANGQLFCTCLECKRHHSCFSLSSEVNSVMEHTAPKMFIAVLLSSPATTDMKRFPHCSVQVYKCVMSPPTQGCTKAPKRHLNCRKSKA